MMPFLGTLANFAAVLVGGLLGTLAKRGISERFSRAVVTASALCVIYIGIDGSLGAAPAVREGFPLSAELVKMLVMILSLTLGGLLGEWLDIDALFNRFGAFVERKLTHGETAEGGIAKGLVACSLLFCVGAMAVNGAFEDAVGKPDILLAKAVIDGINCFAMAAAMGIGCALSAFVLLFYQGAITLIALLAASAVPAGILSYMSVTGSLVILSIGTNMLGVTKIKTANFVPALFLPLLFSPLLTLLLA